jgi:hypothetical protein
MNLMQRIGLSFFASTLLLLSTHRAFADDGYVLGIGKNVIPMHNSSIEMTSEILRISLFQIDASNNERPFSKIDVQATFTFKNTGNDETILMGFPISTFMADEEGYHMTPGDSLFTNFRTVINGQEVSVEVKAGTSDESVAADVGDSYSSFYVWPVHFKKGETKTIYNSYLYDMAESIGDRSILYTLKTGALWKGPIGKLDIYIDLGALNKDLSKAKLSGRFPDLAITPKGYTIKNNVIEWHLKDYEPDEDIDVSLISHALMTPEERKELGVEMFF